MKNIFDFKTGAYILFFTAFLCFFDAVYILSRPISLVVLFHDVYDYKLDEFGIDESELKTKVKEFINNGYKILSPGEFENGLKNGFDLFSKNLLITFDDGKKSSAEAIKMLKTDFGINSVFFVITDFIDKKDMASKEALVDLQEKYGCLIGLHGKRHEEITKILERNEDLAQELILASKFLSEITGKETKWYAYPYGETSEKALGEVMKAGFEYIFTIESDFIHSQTSKYEIPRVMYSKHAPQNGLSDIGEYAKAGYTISDFKFHIYTMAILIAVATLYLYIDKIKRKKQNSL